MKKKICWRFENPTLLRWVLSLPYALWVVHLTKHGSLPALALCRHATVCDQTRRDLNEPWERKNAAGRASIGPCATRRLTE
ncbi:hypothetical protein EDB86DRAFT_2952385 [Lactarius hatsudake]|nr:hypothetical protein EDB86DRAFT_2952385 [Lactarius hatsudake]